MLSTLGVTTVLLLLLGIGVAEIADLKLLAEKGGFLLGNAYRCGVSTKRADRTGAPASDRCRFSRTRRRARGSGPNNRPIPKRR